MTDRTQNVSREHPSTTETLEANDALDEMAAEVEAMRVKIASLEEEILRLQREHRRLRRNVGYRIARAISDAFKTVSRFIRCKESGQSRKNLALYTGYSGSQRGTALSSELLAFLPSLTRLTKSAFYLAPSPRNELLHKQLMRKGIHEVCRGSADLLADMLANRLFPNDALPPQNGCPLVDFSTHDLVIIDVSVPDPAWSLFIGRLWPHQKLLFHGDPQAIRKLAAPHVPNREGPDFAFFDAPPGSWLDPRHPARPSVQPWKSQRIQLAPTLPSGHPWPRISVVTPTFNQGNFIEATIQSVLRQPYPNLEYLILDGGSTDGTQRILDKYRERVGYCVSEKDDGQADAINKGFSRSTGEILAWLNSDDLYATDALVRVAQAFDSFPDADVVVGGCGLLHDPSASIASIHHSRLPLNTVVPLPAGQLLDIENCWLKGHFFYQPEVFWRRRIWDAVGASLSTGLYYSFDYELWVRMAKAGAKVVHIPDLLCLYRVHPAQKTFGEELPYVPELRRVNERLRNLNPTHVTA